MSIIFGVIVLFVFVLGYVLGTLQTNDKYVELESKMSELETKLESDRKEYLKLVDETKKLKLSMENNQTNPNHTYSTTTTTTTYKKRKPRRR